MSSIGRGFAGSHLEAHVLTDECGIKSEVIERAKPYLLLVSGTGNVSLFFIFWASGQYYVNRYYMYLHCFIPNRYNVGTLRIVPYFHKLKESLISRTLQVTLALHYNRPTSLFLYPMKTISIYTRLQRK
jgi:hypothetical protein